ncbi:hypothetical protein GGX14DRAFT_398864 [Mycena pura]|uniref:Uncharacterized protein n=1 Tax=Mycena pura TaxID=153505 RepID=A0AAD6Y7B2_9AGAR|nr:hypothetical protein GGX14DRAFT_398864 [Mycena pura]
MDGWGAARRAVQYAYRAAVQEEHRRGDEAEGRRERAVQRRLDGQVLHQDLRMPGAGQAVSGGEESRENTPNTLLETAAHGCCSWFTVDGERTRSEDGMRRTHASPRPSHAGASCSTRTWPWPRRVAGEGERDAAGLGQRLVSRRRKTDNTLGWVTGGASGRAYRDRAGHAEGSTVLGMGYGPGELMWTTSRYVLPAPNAPLQPATVV